MIAPVVLIGQPCLVTQVREALQAKALTVEEMRRICLLLADAEVTKGAVSDILQKHQVVLENLLLGVLVLQDLGVRYDDQELFEAFRGLERRGAWNRPRQHRRL